MLFRSLAMASLPSYDPNVFITGFTSPQWQEMERERVFLNRALSAYAPGSTYKMITATAGLETGHITMDTIVNCPGYYRIPGLTMKNWKTTGHGRVDILRAIQVSNNTFFWTIAHRMGQDPIAKYAMEFGFGSKTGIDLPAEARGVVPTTRYKLEQRLGGVDSTHAQKVRQVEARYAEQVQEVTKEYAAQAASAGKRDLSRVKRAEEKELERLEKEKKDELDRLNVESEAAKEQLEDLFKQREWELTWHLYDTLNGAVGQGYVMVTPLQLANYTAAIANGGTLYKPQLVNKVVAPDGTVVKEFGPEILGQVSVSPQTLATIRDGMHLGSKGEGTAAGSFANFPWTAGTKTGTAEVGSLRHALFVAFAPYENPEVAVAVVVELGGQGSAAAAPVGRAMLDAYFTRDEVQETEAEEEAPAAPAPMPTTPAQPAAPGPDPGPSPGPDPGPSPGPDPGPSPAPDPGPVPAPSDPEPQDPAPVTDPLPWELPPAPPGPGQP